MLFLTLSCFTLAMQWSVRLSRDNLAKVLHVRPANVRLADARLTNDQLTSDQLTNDQFTRSAHQRSSLQRSAYQLGSHIDVTDLALLRYAHYHWKLLSTIPPLNQQSPLNSLHSHVLSPCRSTSCQTHRSQLLKASPLYTVHFTPIRVCFIRIGCL